MTRKIIKIAYHRNGVYGERFHVCTFTDKELDPSNGEFVAIVFGNEDSAVRTALLNIPELVKGNIDFANGNSWRGDHYDAWLRDEIKKDQKRKDAEWDKKHPPVASPLTPSQEA